MGRQTPKANEVTTRTVPGIMWDVNSSRKEGGRATLCCIQSFNLRKNFVIDYMCNAMSLFLVWEVI